MRLSIARVGVGLAVLAWGCGALAVVGAPIAANDKGKPVSTADKLRHDLDQNVTLKIQEQPLGLAVNQIREQTKLNLVLDRFTLQQAGIDPDMVPVTVDLKDVKLRSALRTIFGPYNLSFAIIGDTVLVSTDEVTISRQMRQRVTVDVDGIDLTAAIKQLSRETATNLVIDPRVAKEAQGKVTLQVEDVPLETAVRLMTEMVGLKPVKVGNTLFICSKVTARDLRDDEPGAGERPIERADRLEKLVIPTPAPVFVPPQAVPGVQIVPPATAPALPPIPADPPAKDEPKKEKDEKKPE
jgi:type II secretory pathway component GspD/PulD (secretin)